MATRKVLFVLSLALLINSELHCMNNIKNMAMALGCTFVALVVGIFFRINSKQQELLDGSCNTDVFTAKKSTGGKHKFFQRTRDQLEIYGIFNFKTNDDSYYANDDFFTTDDYDDDGFFTDSSHAYLSTNKRFNTFYKQVIKILVPKKREIFFGQNNYNNIDNLRRLKIIKCMMDNSLSGIIALILSTDDQKRRTTLVLSCGCGSSVSSYKAFHLFDNGENVSLVENIKKCIFGESTFEYPKKNSSHIVLATENVSEKNLKKALERGKPLSVASKFIISKGWNIIDEKGQQYSIKAVSGVYGELEKYQNRLIESVFQKDDDVCCKQGKAVLMIPFFK